MAARAHSTSRPLSLPTPSLSQAPGPRPTAPPGFPPSPESHLLLALLLQVHLHLQRLAGFQEGLAMLAVRHVVGHDAHDDGAQVEEDVGQDLRVEEEERTGLMNIYLQGSRDREVRADRDRRQRPLSGPYPINHHRQDVAPCQECVQATRLGCKFIRPGERRLLLSYIIPPSSPLQEVERPERLLATQLLKQHVWIPSANARPWLSSICPI